MAGVLIFDVGEGVSLRGMLAALEAMGVQAHSGAGQLSWARFLAEELLEAAGAGEFDQAGIGACLKAISSLAPEAVYVSPFPTGHRVLVPGALYGAGGGMAQPEAVALLAALSVGPTPPPFILEAVFGAEGDVRVLKGRPEGAETTKLVVLEANIDDMSGEMLAPLPALLMAAGALDAWLAPILMKKGRPAHMVSALCTGDLAPQVRRALFLNSSTLGVRSHEVGRAALERRIDEVATPWGAVRLKVALLDGVALRGAPEYSDCEKLASQSGVPLGSVYETALDAWRKGGR